MAASPAWPGAAELDAEQARVAGLSPPRWTPPPGGFVAGGVFLAFARGEQGPGHTGDRGWAGAALVAVPGHAVIAEVAVVARAGAPYQPARLALREGPALAAAVDALGSRPDVLLVDATGRDHPRRGGLALHLGAVLEVPTIGVTHRPLCATGPHPGDTAGASSPLVLDGEVVGAWVRTVQGVRPVAVHAAWRTDVAAAVAIALACTDRARTPEPLRRARTVARVTRARAEGRGAPPLPVR